MVFGRRGKACLDGYCELKIKLLLEFSLYDFYFGHSLVLINPVLFSLQRYGGGVKNDSQHKDIGLIILRIKWSILSVMTNNTGAECVLRLKQI
jgi:hypothetical protein